MAAGFQLSTSKSEGCTWLWLPDKVASERSCMKALLGQPTLPQCTSPLQPSWPGAQHQQATAACQVSQLQQILLTRQIFALFISTCNHIRDPLDHKDCTGLYKKRQSNFLMHACPSLAPSSCVQQLYSSYTAIR